MRSMKVTAFLMFLLFMPLVSRARDVRIDPFAAIEAHGSITISDGSSFYRFSKDGAFFSGFVGEDGGRTITGTWKRSTDRPNVSFVVVGKWSWINGLSRWEDPRMMVLELGMGTFRDRHANELLEMGDRLFDCYFFIDELRTVLKPTP